MATGTSRARSAAGLAVVALMALVGLGCGASSQPAAAPAHGRELAFFEPRPAPSAWPRAHLADPRATIAVPPGWHRIQGDRGTLSAERLGAGGRITGYLNLTPRQPGETLATWTAFRPAHNRREGNRAVDVRAVSRPRRFGATTATCVQDDYTTSTRARYRELACLFVGARGGVVLVGAAPPSAWRQSEPSLARVIESLRLR